MQPLTTFLSPEQHTVLDAVRATAERESISAYLVGGAVRDWLLGQQVGDLDFAVEGDAITFAQALAREFGGDVMAHDQFRTATWFAHGEAVDVVTARDERYERPAVLPRITPATIAEDLRRRDFTINAIALALRDDRLIDPHDGRGDLDRRLIRALHARSFIDDPTRIFRAARYAARLGFAVEEETRAWIDRGLPHLNALSGERVKYDLELIFMEAEPERALALLRQWGVFQAMGIAAPEDDALAGRYARLRDKLFGGDEWDCDSLAASLGGAADEIPRAAGWGALTYNLGQMSASRWVERIPFTAEVRDALVAIGALSTLAPAAFRGPNSRQSELLSSFSGLALMIGWLFDRDPLKRQAMRAEWHDWRWVRPATTGDDLKARGLPPGPRYSQLLARLRNGWLDKEVNSLAEEQQLLETLLAG